MSVYPTHLALAPGQNGGQTLLIDWSDSRQTAYDVRRLREACPCATCREQREQPAPATLLPVLSPAELAPLTIAAMRPVGAYAYTIAFSDGHDTGIYSFERLRDLAGEP